MDAPPPDPRHMTPDEFRRFGREVVDLLADYWESLESRPVIATAPPTRPGDVLAALPALPPDTGEPMQAVLDDVRSIILPALTHWQSPNFFGFFPANASFPAILGDLLSSGLGVQGMLWATSPACTELETRVLDWLVNMLGLPAAFLSTCPAGSGSGGGGGGVIHATASEATLTALVAARARARAVGHLDHHVLYTSTQAHSSVVKAAMIAGLADNPADHRHVRLIDVDRSFALRPDLLEKQIVSDRRAGLHPTFICATLGTTSSTGVDRLAEIGPIARANNLWLHADAAFLGSACVCPEYRWILDGVENCDSFCFNPHKWLLTNFDCSCFWTRDRAGLVGALSITPEYLRNTASTSGAVTDYRDWQIPLGRRFRALKLWMVIRHYGVEGLRAYIRGHVRLGELFESLVAGDDRFELAAERTSSLVCFRLKGRGESADAANRALLERLNASGKLSLTHTVLPTFGDAAAGAEPDEPTGSHVVLRLAIGATLTEERHVRGAWAAIGAEADRVRSET